ncbi:hypothetical protein PV05_03744 [Exophiala xenobiotica]|uniref:Uncharacterized protein n=1 Tax=Exophiala xenobiotica TaxID=348802 RepID=A0A0D2DAC8_9EURO|nr:uncharacterized protein PV05_03744 [Exophiala xenobiotica]KIW59287.1 hypothetical protein PV05_03744 [Exophiala xenobiotica]
MTASALPAADHTVVTDAAPSNSAADVPSSTIEQAAPAQPLNTSDDFDESYDDHHHQLSLQALAYAASAPDAEAESHHDKRSPGSGAMQPKGQKQQKDAKKPKQYMWCTSNRDYCTSWYAAPGESYKARREVEKRDGMSNTANKKDQEVWCNAAGKCVYWYKDNKLDVLGTTPCTDKKRMGTDPACLRVPKHTKTT